MNREIPRGKTGQNALLFPWANNANSFKVRVTAIGFEPWEEPLNHGMLCRGREAPYGRIPDRLLDP
jgi:hypothetical protein